MSTYFNDLDELRIKLFMERFTEEHSYLTSLDIDHDLDSKERISNLEKIIKMIDDGINSKKLNEKKSLNDELDEMNRQTYKRPWNRLPSYHKEIKVIEYIKELVDDDEIQKELIEKLIDLINKNKINTKKYVDYNSSECKIIKLKFLMYDEENSTYDLRV